MKKIVHSSYKTYTILDRDEAAKKFAKLLITEFKEKSSKEDFCRASIEVYDRVDSDCFTDKKGVRHDISYVHDYSSWEGDSIYFDRLKSVDDERNFLSLVTDMFFKGIKLKKGDVYKLETETYCSGSYYNRVEVIKKIVIVRPCKEFAQVNKKLVALGLNPIPVLAWNIAEVFGKRSNYEVMRRVYLACSSSKCGELLTFLKGKKKLSYQFKETEHLEDREYGEEYETEWNGSIEKRIVFTDSTGHQHSF